MKFRTALYRATVTIGIAQAVAVAARWYEEITDLLVEIANTVEPRPLPVDVATDVTELVLGDDDQVAVADHYVWGPKSGNLAIVPVDGRRYVYESPVEQWAHAKAIARRAGIEVDRIQTAMLTKHRVATPALLDDAVLRGAVIQLLEMLATPGDLPDPPITNVAMLRVAGGGQ